MSLNDHRDPRRSMPVQFVAAAMCLTVGLSAQPPVHGQTEQNVARESRVAASVAESRMLETVRRLVGFGTRMYGTPSNRAAAAWLAGAFRASGLEVTIRKDSPRDWYQPVSWEVRATPDGPGSAPMILKTTWPSSGAPSGKGDGLLAIDSGPGAVCLT
jgi:hypothetical protein